ncbi:hypothetical protein LINGRAHAP2_LOCUS8387, partial [Linum grandiflorum]
AHCNLVSILLSIFSGISTIVAEYGESSNTVVNRVHFDATDLQDARKRARPSLLRRIFWDEPEDLRLVEQALNTVCNITSLQVFDVGFGLYQFVFPTVSKRDFVLKFQPWSFRRDIIHFTAVLTPSADLFESLSMMNIWVKVEGLHLECRTTTMERRLLAPLGELIYIGYFDANLPIGFYINGMVRKDLFGSFHGTTDAGDESGHNFHAFFQYVNVPCICYKCGYLGHVVSEFDQQDLELNLNARDSWICISHNKDEHEVEGPDLHPVVQSHRVAR